jgi:hypothetical protein
MLPLVQQNAALNAGILRTAKNKRAGGSFTAIEHRWGASDGLVVFNSALPPRKDAGGVTGVASAAPSTMSLSSSSSSSSSSAPVCATTAVEATDAATTAPRRSESTGLCGDALVYPDLIVASEVVYDEELFQPLIDTLLLFTQPCDSGSHTSRHSSSGSSSHSGSSSRSGSRGSRRPVPILLAARRRAGAHLDSFLERAGEHFDTLLVPWATDSGPGRGKAPSPASVGGTSSSSSPAAALSRLVTGCTAMSKTRYSPMLFVLTRKVSSSVG